MPMSAGPPPSPPRRTTPLLHRLATRGKLQKVNAILANAPEEQRLLLLQERDDKNGEFPSHCAARAGHSHVVKVLLPERCPRELVDGQSREGGWSALHLAAGSGDGKLVEWLIEEREADPYLQDSDGNTALHFAVALGHGGVAQILLDKTAGVLTTIANNKRMLPFSFCKDTAMFDVLFTRLFAEENTSSPFQEPHAQLPVDGCGRTILHIAAQFASWKHDIAKLIETVEPGQLLVEDIEGDNFLHVAAKHGNVHIIKHAAISSFGACTTSSECIHRLSLLALFNGHRTFFDQLVAMGRAAITLEDIVTELSAELIGDPAIQDRVTLFSCSLPTYLALYAKKYDVYKFLLEKKLFSVSQWDDKYKRTCLHWAVVDRRTDIIRYLCQDFHLRPEIEDKDGKSALQLAFEMQNNKATALLRQESSFKDLEENLYRDREVYVQALNAVLVVAALIAGATFAGWLQTPSDDFQGLGLKIFWVSNSSSFSLAVASMLVTMTALLPTPTKYVGDIVKQLRIAIVVDAICFALSVAAVNVAFAAAGFAALRHSHFQVYETIMIITTVVGNILCVFFLAGFIMQLSTCSPSYKTFLATLFSVVPVWLRRHTPNLFAGVGECTRVGYNNKARHDITLIMTRDLVGYYGEQESKELSKNFESTRMLAVLEELGTADKQGFINRKNKCREGKAKFKSTSEYEMKRILSCFDRPVLST